MPRLVSFKCDWCRDTSEAAPIPNKNQHNEVPEHDGWEYFYHPFKNYPQGAPKICLCPTCVDAINKSIEQVEAQRKRKR